MNNINNINNIKYLVDKLNNASNFYYNHSTEIISDFEYDKLYDELVSLEQKYNIVLSNSPTIKVGHTILDELQKIPHDVKMLSLDKTKSIDKLESFLEDMSAILSLKLDGLTIVLKYNNKKLVSAITRGNGEIGENILHNVKVFSNIPLEIPFDEEITIRGEAIITFEEFEIINQKLDALNKYKNPRNLCSGTVRQLNNQITKERNVKFLAFSLINNNNTNNNFNNNFKLKSQQLDFLKSLGFDIVDYYKVNRSNIRTKILELEKSIQDTPFATDGLVITFDDLEYSKNLGVTSKFPKDAIAFKWSDNLAETILLDVEWNTSRTGLINPVAIFEPVELEGTTVNRASLHNVSIIKNLKLGIGDTISVYKANMIIPQIAENYTLSDTLEIPQVCGVCGEKSEIISIRDGLALKCNNLLCKAQSINKIIHYVSRNAVNINNFSKATIQKFVENKFISDYTDIYFLEKYEQDIINLKGYGEKSYNKLIIAINNSKKINLYNFIYALGIEHIGLSNAKLLVKKFDNNLDSIIKASVCEDPQEILFVDGFGEVIANSLKKYFSNQENINNINKVIGFLEIIPEDNNLNNNLILENKTFVITGSLDQFKNRSQLQNLIQDLGGKVSSSISKNTSYLINNDNTSQSSKNKTANKLNIDIITEDEFINKFNINI